VLSGEQCAAHLLDLTQPVLCGAACRTAYMDVVDLTDGTHDDPLIVSRDADGADSARVDGIQFALS